MSLSNENGLPTERLTGYVIRVCYDDGYGFVRGKDGLSRFFHAKDVEDGMFDLLRPKLTVSFVPIDISTERNPALIKGNGLQATQIRIQR